MKVLHTSDWHIGRSIRGKSRNIEQASIIAEIAELCETNEIDLVLIAGDIFDHAAPSARAEDTAYKGLLSLAATGAQVVAIAGNHDNAIRWSALKPILKNSNIVVVSELAEEIDQNTIDITTKSGEVAKVACLPWISQRRLVRAADLMNVSRAEHQMNYRNGMQEILKRLAEPFTEDTVNLMMAHLAMSEGTLDGSERKAETVIDYCLDVDQLPSTAQYCALGHYHKRQRLQGGAGEVWYSGSPTQLNFGEQSDIQGVNIFEVQAGQMLKQDQIVQVSLNSGYQLRTISGNLPQLESLLQEKGPDLLSEGVFLRVNVEEPQRTGLAQEVRELFPNAVAVQTLSTMIEEPQIARDLHGLDPHDLFSDYLKSKKVQDERLLSLFDQLYVEASNETSAT